jgi:RNA polymerase sigma-70 factor (ECF subfamily)
MSPSRQYLSLLSTARRHARRADEAEDIVQDVMLAAIAAGRVELADPDNRRWMAGAIRRRAAFDARSAARRQKREGQWQAGRSAEVVPEPREALAEVLAELPSSLRVLAALALSGQSRHEIAYLLHLSDTALRQRIAALKKALRARGLGMPDDLPGLTLDLAYGQIRSGLAPYLARHAGAFAAHDPDGHFFVVRRSQNPMVRQQGMYETPIEENSHNAS